MRTSRARKTSPKVKHEIKEKAGHMLDQLGVERLGRAREVPLEDV
jgi:hypothetical protein